MMQLENPVSHRQAYAAAFAFGGEVEVEDLLPNLLGDARALVADAQNCRLAVLFENDLERAAMLHGLCAVLDHVEHRLLEQVGIDIGEHGLVW